MSQSIAFGTPMARDSANASALRYAVLPGIMLLHYRALDELHASPVSALVLDHRGRSTGVRVISIQSRKRVTAYSRISRKRSFDIWIHAFHPSARGKRIASILGPDFAALAPRRVKNGENKADKGSINGEMGICGWRDYGIIEN